MRPDGLELVRGVRRLLAGLAPEMGSPHLRTQVMLAVGLLDAAAAELNDAPAAYHEERGRMIALAGEALPAVRQFAPSDALAADVEAWIGAASEPGERRLSALVAASAREMALLDRLSAFCETHAEDGEMATLGVRVTAELRMRVERRATWGGGVRQ